MDYDRILDEGLMLLHSFRAKARATSINDMVEAELSRKLYKRMLKSDEFYRLEAKKKVAAKRF